VQRPAPPASCDRRPDPAPSWPARSAELGRSPQIRRCRQPHRTRHRRRLCHRLAPGSMQDRDALADGCSGAMTVCTSCPRSHQSEMRSR
jgi:hypothetical protein